MLNVIFYLINKRTTMADMIDQQRVFEMLPISKEQRLKLIEELVKEHAAGDLNLERTDSCSDDTKTCSLSLADKVDCPI